MTLPDVRASTMPTSATDTAKTCLCIDPKVDQLRDLIAQGIPQAEASRRLWGPPPPPPPDPEPTFETRPFPLFRWIGQRDRST